MKMEKELLPHQVRVLFEQEELNERLQKLIAFLDTNVFASLDKDEQELLLKQREAMGEYNFILTERIKRFST